MALRKLFHYNASNPATADTAFNALPAGVPATGRALVVSKVILWNLQGVSHRFILYAGADASVAGQIIAIATLANDQEGYTVPGLIVPPGQGLIVRWSNATANTLAVNVYGEEVDN